MDKLFGCVRWDLDFQFFIDFVYSFVYLDWVLIHPKPLLKEFYKTYKLYKILFIFYIYRNGTVEYLLGLGSICPDLLLTYIVKSTFGTPSFPKTTPPDARS